MESNALCYFSNLGTADLLVYLFIFSCIGILLPGLMHLRTWVHFLARHEIRTNNYILLQKKQTLEAVKLTSFPPFHTHLQSFD